MIARLRHRSIRSVTVISDADRWRILGSAVAQIPANGLLAAKLRKKYGLAI